MTARLFENWLLAAGVLPLLLCACTADPLYCDEDTRCTDPDRPFCDLNGDYPASEGVGRTCIPDPHADAGAGDADAETGGGARDAGGDGDADTSCVTRLVFVSLRDTNAQIYLSDADGQNQTNLSQSTSTDRAPRWSPDGARIAFVRDSGVWTMNADGSDPLQLTDGPNDDDPQWSPDGDRVAFVRNDGGTINLWVVDASGGAPAQLTTAGALRYSWSPDGSKLAFGTERDGNREIYTMRSDGSDEANRTYDPSDDDVPTWSRDGARILFRSFRSGNEDLWVMAAIGSSPQNLTSTPEAERDAVFTPDGSRVVYQRQTISTFQLLLGTFESDLYSMSSDGSDQQQLTFEEGEDGDPAVSPDGTRIAWTQNAAGIGTDVHVASIDGTGDQNLTTSGVDSDPAWQPCQQAGP
ncbi:MAG TPA: DPP IV N-terminal domain-containing protein [Kofleriaceae bacterium]|nr:DPP IV N-terminal domain-containing protein [Kofleriaceae bacterium]